MLKTTPASQIARQLNEEDVPSPDSGRSRIDNQNLHMVFGKWHATTITNIGRHHLNRALTTYGRRSMGDRRRVTPDWPRAIEDSDIRYDEKPKVIQNPVENQIVAPAHGEAAVPIEQFEKVKRILDERAATQCGKPRSRDPRRNPLGGRIFYMACGWRMYRAPYGTSFRYTCAHYLQTH